MTDNTRILGDVVKKAREATGLSQLSLSRATGVDNRTILNIENYRGNPEYKNLYPIIRYLKIDANQIFYPESQQESPSIRQLSALINDCTEKEANAIYPLVESVILMLRNQSAQNINA